MSTRFAFIGFGEAGPCIAAGLQEAGATVTATYDVLLRDGPAGDGVRARAEALGITAHDDPAEAVIAADVVVSAVTSDQTVAAARDTAPHLVGHQFYLDINSASPALKRGAAELVEGAGASFVEAAVMSNVPPHGHKVPMLLAGTRAADLAAILSATGMDVETVGEEIGQASAIKMCRSVMVKGLESLFVECLTTAHRLGVEERVLDSLYESFPGFDWRKYAGYHLGRVVMHARRRAAEMHEAADTVEEAGIDPQMASASAAVLDRVAGFGLRKMFSGDLPDAYLPFLKALHEAEKS